MKQGQQIRVKGLVQGVGFRPTVWIIANKLKLKGQVLNDGQGVLIKIFANDKEILNFINTLKTDCPPLARIDSIELKKITAKAPIDFTIVASKATAAHTGIVPDAATCNVCVAETLDANNRRYHYPFSNCTHCGPRLTIIKAIPYDRKNTSMAAFVLCDACQKEYDHPADRRFHAQPNACPVCGPEIWLEPKNDQTDTLLIISNVSKLLKQGKIIAIKGIGGFHLACDASKQQAVQTLRSRKHRAAKPFALMAKDINTIKQYCIVSKKEQELLSSSVAPIVLLNKQPNNQLPKEIAPGQKTLGFMLPYTPLQHLLLQYFAVPLVMTSGNSSELPQCIDNIDAKEKLANIADYWLFNNRDIVNRVDDSVVRVVADKIQVLRRARGYAPTSMPLPKGFENSLDVLACGGELKNTFCLVKDGLAVLSQHIGDLKNSNTYDDYEHTLKLFQNLYQHQPKIIAIDAHPDYLSSQYGKNLAQQHNLSLCTVQHHHAHIASCLAENNWALNQGQVLGVALDGLGYGNDDNNDDNDSSNIWGGEFLLADYHTSQRLACLKSIALLGGSQAMYQPWRNTYAQLLSHFDWQYLEDKFADLTIIQYLKQQPKDTLDAMLAKNLNSPLASSTGRLFDAVAASVGICCQQIQYEGQAAIELEALVSDTLLTQEKNHAYELSIDKDKQGFLQISTRLMWQSILADLKQNTERAVIATRFHLGLANALVNMAVVVLKSNSLAVNTIVLTGGVFQNKILLTQTKKLLHKQNFTVLTHSQIPANDGGIALGQAVIALAQQQKMEIKPCV
ncbi:MAG: carbamoyltransferase HypF [Proteobacteria bacterium]|nr:carbamoyltransferase HypF [Pseudomonadota bacterium]